MNVGLAVRVPAFRVEADAPDLLASPDAKLWAACLRRALCDALGCPGSDNVSRTSARRWFRLRGMKTGGWGWMIEALDLPSHVVREIERAALRPVREAEERPASVGIQFRGGVVVVVEGRGENRPSPFFE